MRRIGFWMATIGVCGLVLVGGCAKHAKVASAETKTTAKAVQKLTGKPVDLSLKFNAGDMNTYKVVTESVKDYKFEQPSINQTKEQQTLNRIEVVYDQKIQSIDPAGNAKALITIKEVKCLSKNPKGITLDFDSANGGKGALGNLIGQSYVITITSAGEVAAVEDVQKALDAVKGDSMEQKTAQSLLADVAIKQRHTLTALPEKKDASVKVGKTWNKIKAGPAGMLTPKSYEEVYMLKEVKKDQGQDVAVVAMEARPSTVKVADASSEEAKGMGFFAKMFDNKETYTGAMTMNVNTGTVKSYSEKLKSEWVAVEPTEEQKSDKGPDVLTMGFTYLYSIEKLN